MDKDIKLMIVESDHNFGLLLKSFFSMKSYQSKLCSTASEAIRHFETQTVDFIISEINLPDKHGFDMMKRIREMNSNIPLIFMSKEYSRTDMTHGLESGADDYIIKPFSLEELFERFKSISRRKIYAGYNRHIYHISTYKFDIVRQLLIRNGTMKKLTGREKDLLLLFCQYKNRVLDRSYALQKIWKDDSYFSARNMDVYITKLRKMFREDPNIEIKNIHGVGYKLLVREYPAIG